MKNPSGQRRVLKSEHLDTKQGQYPVFRDVWRALLETPTVLRPIIKFLASMEPEV
jgi:hypothetical protein